MKSKKIDNNIKIEIDKLQAQFIVNSIKDLDLFIGTLIIGNSIGTQFHNPILMKIKNKVEYLNNLKHKIESELT